MNRMSENILKAVDIVLNDAISKIKFDKTVKGEIKSLINANTGEYKVSTENSSDLFSAFVENTSIVYEVGDLVYIKIPEGDYTNKKIIESKVSITEDSGSNNSVSQEINTIKPSINDMYNIVLSDQIGLISGIAPYEKNLFNITDKSNNLFVNYNKFYSKIQIKASFKTNFLTKKNNGNYGLKIDFYTNDSTNETMSFYLDTSSFVGSPYEYSDFSEQSIELEIGTNILTGLKSISFFQQDMAIDRTQSEYVIENGELKEIPGKDITDTENIFVKDIQIHFIEIVDYSKEKYYLQIQAPKGTTFVNNNVNYLTLVGVLKYFGKEISSADYSCSWYEENYSITLASEFYDSLAGAGWKKIDITKNSLDVEKDLYLSSKKYRLIINYQNTILSKEITINFTEPKFQIRQSDDNRNNISLLVFDINNNIQYNKNIDWYRRTPDNAYSFIETNSTININNYFVYSYIIFYALIKDENNNIIGQESITLQKPLTEEELKVNFKGTSLYHYDSNGDITIANAEQDRTLFAEVLFSDGYATAYKSSWLINGVVIGNTSVNPINSMMKDVWVDVEGILHYHINPKFKQGYINNELTFKIQTLEGKEFEFIKEIIFIKDGDQGTNGTTYVCLISPYENNIKKSGFYSLHYVNENNLLSSNTITLRACVYKDGELINNLSNYKITYKWESRSSTITIIGNTNQEYVEIRGTSLKLNNQILYQHLIKVTIKIDNEISLYNNTPINISIGSIQDNLVDTNIPNYIRYTSNGVDPVFNNNDLSFLYNGFEKISTITSFNTNLIEIEKKQIDNNYIYSLKPTSYFDYENGIGALKCIISDSSYIIYPIMMYLNTYGNQAINDWDGTSIKIDEANNTILAPQIGAGEKNSVGQFTGVIMGKLTGSEVENKIGLYGYQDGICSFSLTEDGIATIGKAGKGQIIIDGDNASITSGNYNATEGMKINLANGNITSYNFSLNSAALNIKQNRFEFDLSKGITSDNLTTSIFTIKNGNTNLFYINSRGTTGNKYYLQSTNYTSGTSGMKLDLENGKVDINSGSIKIGNCIISDNKLQLGADGEGKITIENGSIKLTGNITWDTTSNPVKILYNQNYQSSPTRNYDDYPNYDSSGWHKILSSNDSYASYSYSGGTNGSWGIAIQIKGQNGQDGSDASVTWNNIKNALQLAASTEQTFITADAAGSPNIYGGNIYGTNIYGSNIYATTSGREYLQITESGLSYNNNLQENFYLKATSDGVTFGSTFYSIVVGSINNIKLSCGGTLILDAQSIDWRGNAPAAVFG